MPLAPQLDFGDETCISVEFASVSGGHHPYFTLLSHGKKTGELGRAHPGERGVLRPGEHGAKDVNALITAQLAADAVRMLAILSVSTLSFRNLFLWLCPMPLSPLKWWFSNVHCKSKY
jgi:hypothetical protein